MLTIQTCSAATQVQMALLGYRRSCQLGCGKGLLYTVQLGFEMISKPTPSHMTSHISYEAFTFTGCAGKKILATTPSPAEPTNLYRCTDHHLQASTTGTATTAA